MSTIKSSNEHLTLNADGSSKDIKFQANGVEKASISSAGAFTSTTIDATKLTGNLPAISGASLTNVNAVNGGRKNMIINGAMQVAQRGATSTSEGYASVDRFFTYKENTDQLTITQATHDTVPDGFGASWKIDVGTAETSIEANDLYQITTRLEGQDLQHLKFGTSSAQSITLQFWARSSKTGTYVVNLYNSGSTRNITNTYTISTINTWEHKTMTFVGDTSNGFANTNARGLDVQWQLMAGSNFTGTASTSWGAVSDARQANGQSTTWGEAASDTFYITGVQLEVGSTATDFEQRSYGEELALCQRYYFAPSQSSMGIGRGDGSAGLHCSLPIPVPLRANPTVPSTVSVIAYMHDAASSQASSGISNPVNREGQVTFTLASLSSMNDDRNGAFKVNSSSWYFDSEL